MFAKIAAAGVMLLFALCLICPATAGNVVHGNENIAPSYESPLVLKKAAGQVFTVVPSEGEHTLVFDLSSRPDSVVIKCGSRNVASFKPERLQFSADITGYEGQSLTVNIKCNNNTALTVYALDSVSDLSKARLWKEDASNQPVCLCGTVDDAKKALSADNRFFRYIIFQKPEADEEDDFTHRAYDAGVRVYPEFLGLRPYQKDKMTEKSLEKYWNTDKIFRKLVTLVRLSMSDTIYVCAEDETVSAFLEQLSVKIAGSAAEHDFSGDKTSDQYLTAVNTIENVVTGSVMDLAAPSVAARAEAAWPEQPAAVSTLPTGLGADGFMTDGAEPWIVQDTESGKWIYVSDDLHIEIKRCTREKPALVWYEADIRICDESDEYLKTIGFPNGKANKPEKLFDETGIVFGINTDLYQYRKNYNTQIGLIVRQGNVLYEMENAKDRRDQFPPLDTLLLSPDGKFELRTAGELSADEAIASGASDVLSFGPILVLNGNLRVHSPKVGSAKEPRTAIGLLGDRHYLAVTVEGRLKRSEGITLADLGQLMLARGCSQAINLDGGHTSVMMFMGERINTIGSFTGSGAESSSRNLYELLGVGANK